jgi:pimeloyl-ACP methyl ester carboxylesterase
MAFLTLGGHRIYLEWQGPHDPARETAVFLHDGLGAVGAWKRVPERIGAAAGVNALVYDRWGYGRSDERELFRFQFMEAEVPVLRELLDQLGLARAHLVGHSDGGSIALLLAARWPERVTSLVTEAAHVFVEPETQTGIRALVALQRAGRMPGWLSRLHGERAERLLSAWCDGWLSDAHAQWNIEDWLGYVTAPTLAVQGEQDEFGTPAQVNAILNRVGGADSWIVPNCGHTPHNDAEDEYVERVAGFVRAHLDRAAPGT